MSMFLDLSLSAVSGKSVQYVQPKRAKCYSISCFVSLGTHPNEFGSQLKVLNSILSIVSDKI